MKSTPRDNLKGDFVIKKTWTFEAIARLLKKIKVKIIKKGA